MPRTAEPAPRTAELPATKRRVLPPLCLAARAGDLERIAELSADPANDRLDSLGWSALMHAGALGRTKAARALLSFCDPRLRGSFGRTALMRAAERGRSQIVLMLLPHSDPDARDDLGMRALDLAPPGSHAREILALWAHSRSEAHAIAQNCPDPATEASDRSRL